MIKAVNELMIYRQASGERYIGATDAAEFMFKQEVSPSTNYLPDIERIKENGVRVFMAAGKTSLDKKRFYAETATILAERLGSAMVTFPGHHASYYGMPEAWAASLRDVLHAAERSPAERLPPPRGRRPDHLRQPRQPSA